MNADSFPSLVCIFFLNRVKIKNLEMQANENGFGFLKWEVEAKETKDTRALIRLAESSCHILGARLS